MPCGEREREKEGKKKVKPNPPTLPNCVSAQVLGGGHRGHKKARSVGGLASQHGEDGPTNPPSYSWQQNRKLDLPR